MLFLVILAPLPLPAQRQIVTVPFRSVNSYMLVEASIDGRPATLLVDTGANKTILNARSIGRMHVNCTPRCFNKSLSSSSVMNAPSLPLDDIHSGLGKMKQIFFGDGWRMYWQPRSRWVGLRSTFRQSPQRVIRFGTAHHQ
jgi:hypothetical protein